MSSADRDQSSAADDYELDLEKVSKCWSQTPEQLEQRALTNWMGHEHVKRHIQKRTTGDENLDWLSYIIAKYFQTPVERALSLGCGDGGLERHVLGSGAVKFFDAYDVSAGAIESARRKAEESGVLDKIRYAITDLNQLETLPEEYDAVFASMSIHHIEALESVFNEIRKGLKPNGLFIMNEYIGPTQFQLPASQLDLINDLLTILPPHYRRMIREGHATEDVKQAHFIHPLEWFAQYDPSEAVRSAEILTVLKDYFEIIEFKPYGGALLQFLLDNIVGNFDDTQEADRAWLDVLEYIETTVEEASVIASDFALIVAGPIK